MYRKDEQVITQDDHRFILTHCALGDMICSLPAIIWARQNVLDEDSGGMKMHVYVMPHQVELVTHLLKPYGKFHVLPMSDAEMTYEGRREKWPDSSVSFNTAMFNSHTRNRVHMCDYAWNFLVDGRPESMLQRSYPNAAPLGSYDIVPTPSPYVVFPQGATSDNKLFKASLMAPIMDWVCDQGYTPVLVGKKISHARAQLPDGSTEALQVRWETDKLHALCKPTTYWHDEREKHTLLELRDVLGRAKAVVGIDGGTLHLAGTTDVPIIYAMGTTLPKHRYIARYGDHNHKIKYIVPHDLECLGCQSNWPMTKLDFRFCAYGDSKCMDSFHAEDFITALQELGL